MQGEKAGNRVKGGRRKRSNWRLVEKGKEGRGVERGEGGGC